jgi:hypothetical protein
MRVNDRVRPDGLIYRTGMGTIVGLRSGDITSFQVEVRWDDEAGICLHRAEDLQVVKDVGPDWQRQGDDDHDRELAE